MIRVILFAGIFLSVLLGSHLFLYYSIVQFFGITEVATKMYLIIALALLSSSFFISAALVKTHENAITSVMYTLASIWVGVLTNLTMVAAALWGMYIIGKVFGLPFSIFYMSLSLTIASLIVSGMGVYNAFHPEIKHIEVALKNLPEKWKEKTIVQLSDVHLGVINRKGFLEKVVEKTNSLNPEIVLITGDLFDGMDGALEGFVEGLKNFKTKKGVYFVNGNHEKYLHNEPDEIIKRAGIKVLNNEITEIDGLQLIGVDYPIPGSVSDGEALLNGPDYTPEKPSILLYHTPTDVSQKHEDHSSQQWRDYFHPLTNFTFAKKKKIDLQLSGHTHAGQLFPFNLIARIIWGKYYYGLSKVGDFTIYTSSGTGTWGPPMRTWAEAEIVAITLK